MKILWSLFLFLVIVQANCTEEQMQQAQNLYNQARFKEALKACYSAEIEANLLIVQAEESVDVEKKIGYYKQALISISNFEERELIAPYQNELNQILAGLYESIDREISDIYSLKVMNLLGDDSDDGMFSYVVYLLFILLFGWSVLSVFRKK